MDILFKFSCGTLRFANCINNIFVVDVRERLKSAKEKNLPDAERFWASRNVLVEDNRFMPIYLHVTWQVTSGDSRELFVFTRPDAPGAEELSHRIVGAVARGLESVINVDMSYLEYRELGV